MGHIALSVTQFDWPLSLLAVSFDVVIAIANGGRPGHYVGPLTEVNL